MPKLLLCGTQLELGNAPQGLDLTQRRPSPKSAAGFAGFVERLCGRRRRWIHGSPTWISNGKRRETGEPGGEQERQDGHDERKAQPRAGPYVSYQYITIISRDPNQGLICNYCCGRRPPGSRSPADGARPMGMLRWRTETRDGYAWRTSGLPPSRR